MTEGLRARAWGIQEAQNKLVPDMRLDGGAQLLRADTHHDRVARIIHAPCAARSRRRMASTAKVIATAIAEPNTMRSM